MTKPETEQPSNGTSVKTTPIAIVGIGSIFPQARTTADYWNNIVRKIDTITDVPASRWSIEDYYDPNPSAPDKTYCKRGAFMPDIDFDPLEFGLPPNILEVTDVSQLLALVVAKETLEDAGYGEDKVFDREHTGVVLGVVGMASKLFTPLMTRLQYPIWEKVLRSAGVSDGDTKKIVEKIKLAYVNWEENAFPGAIGNVIAGRIANRFDLGGVNCVVDAACASSLAALKMAVGELIEGRANMMITGGVDTDNTINTYMCFSKTPAFSKGEHVRTFDAESDGMMVGEGIGMVAMKRLEDAERDGDRIYAVIHAIGTSSDGRFKSIYAPRPAGQSKALRRAYAEAGFSPATVGLIEAHGTGTMAGDPAEFEGLRETFGEAGAGAQTVALGSVKSQIAHTKAAAGVASLIKTALALHHKVLPPTINVNKPNPKFSIEKTPFYINTEARPWIRAKDAPPRRAGVSSFGFGGTNFHVVLQEHTREHKGAYRRSRVAKPFLLAAAGPAELRSACLSALEKLDGPRARHEFTLLTRESRTRSVPAESARVGFVAETVEEARQMLEICAQQLAEKPGAETWEHPKGIFYRKNGMETGGRVVALFSGQGSQYLEMGRELALNYPEVRETFAALDELFLADGLEPLSARVYPRPVFDTKEREALSETLTRTEHAQPAIGVVSMALYKLLRDAGLAVDYTAGHSFGELTALWAAGVVDDAGFAALAKARGKAMAPPADPNFDAGTMMAVKGDVEAIRDALKEDGEITLANWNANNQVVIAGTKPAIARAQEKLTGLGFQTIPLPVSAAFHTPLVGHAQKPFAEAIRKVTFHKPERKVYSNGTGQAHPGDPKAIRAALEAHILNPVRFRDEIEQIYDDGGRIFIEFGPKNVLTNLVENILAGKPHLSVALNASPKKDSDRQLREAVMALRVAGLPLVNFDPYAVEEDAAPPRKQSAVTVKVHAGHYVTEKTKQAFIDALNDGFQISQSVTSQPVTSQLVTNPPIPDQPVTSQLTPNQPIPSPELPMTDTLLQQYDAHQTETARLHEQYLGLEEEYARAFGQLTQLQSELVQKAASAPGELAALLPLFESLERSMARFHEHQAETLRVHGRYLETQERLAQSLLGAAPAAPVVPAAPRPAVPAAPAPRPAANITTAVPAPAAPKNGHAVMPPAPVAQEQKPAPAPAPAAEVKPAPVVETRPEPSLAVAQAAHDAEQLTAALLQIVSDKTGYPVETLELDMDMEADLGIDSIKRVEILGAMQTEFPDLPKVEPALLAELRTLGQIVSQMRTPQAAAPETSAAVAAAPAAAPAAEPVAAPAQVPAAGAVSAEEVANALLQIVSDKTGYPVETLELEMDMEADLGIDSIKRVEILGAMQEQFPALPKVEPAVLAELRTLGQIIQQLHGAGTTAQPSGEGTAQSPFDGAVDSVTGTEEPAVPQGIVIRKLLPQPDYMQFDLPEGRVCLISDDGTALTTGLAAALRGQGWQVIVLRLPETVLVHPQPLPEGVGSVPLTGLDETGIQAALAAVEAQYGPVSVFLHLAPSVKEGAETEKSLVKLAFLSAKFLQPSLNAAPGRSAFLAVTRLDGQFGLGEGGGFAPVTGGLFGLVKTLNLEWERVFCRAVDLSPALDAEQAVERILAELHDPNRLVVEVGYTETERSTLALAEPAHSAEQQFSPAA